MSVSRQFGPQGFATGLPDGTLLVADNEAWGFRLLDGAGATTAIVRVDHPRRATSPVLLDSLVAVQRRMIGNSPQATPEMIEAYLAAERAKPMVDSLPPFSAIYPTSGDLVWLGEYLAPGDSASRFTAVDRQGRIVGRLAIPVGSRALAFGSDRVVLRRENADGVVHFAVHRIH